MHAKILPKKNIGNNDFMFHMMVLKCAHNAKLRATTNRHASSHLFRMQKKFGISINKPSAASEESETALGKNTVKKKAQITT